MPTGRRPGHVYRGPVRRPPRPSGVDTMKVAGTLFCISAVISVPDSLGRLQTLTETALTVGALL